MVIFRLFLPSLLIPYCVQPLLKHKIEADLEQSEKELIMKMIDGYPYSE